MPQLWSGVQVGRCVRNLDIDRRTDVGEIAYLPGGLWLEHCASRLICSLRKPVHDGAVKNLRLVRESCPCRGCPVSSYAARRTYQHSLSLA